MAAAHTHIRDSRDVLAAVLGSNANAYDAVRSLTEHGISTVLLAERPPRDGRYPRCKVQICPPPEKFAELVDYLNTRVGLGKRVVPIASSDTYACFLATHGEDLDRRFSFLTAPADLVKRLVNKHEFYHLCQDLNLKTSRTICPENAEDLENKLLTLRFPCVVKALSSSDWQADIGYPVQRVESEEEARRICTSAWNYGRSVLIQEEVQGGPEDIFFVGGLYDERSRPEKILVGNKLQQFPLETGSTSHARLRWNQTVAELANEFVKLSGYQGLIDIEFKRDIRDGEFRIIEVNPRNGLWHRISQNGGCNICTYYVRRQDGQREVFASYEPHCEGTLWIDPQHDLCSCIDQHGIMPGAWKWSGHMWGAKIRCAWNPSDVPRTLRSIRTVAGYVKRRLFSRRKKR